jgi:tRNA (guanine37-N1)-methyltransferase
MQIDVVTAFPGLVEGPLGYSIVRRAREAGLVDVRVHDLRDYTEDRHKKVDDTPYGGGGGMVLMPGPLFAAVEAIRGAAPAAGTRTILFCPQGRRYDQETAERLAGCARLILLCGRYEGVDERVREHLADESISIGDYVLTGGEIPARWATLRRRVTTPFPRDCSTSPSTPARRTSGATRSRKCCFRGTTRASKRGGGSGRWRRRPASGPTF